MRAVSVNDFAFTAKPSKPMVGLANGQWACHLASAGRTACHWPKRLQLNPWQQLPTTTILPTHHKKSRDAARVEFVRVRVLLRDGAGT
jgi:hypothetical protein